MDETPDLPLVLALVGIVFPAFWCVVVVLISRVGGWARLAEVFPARGFPRGTRMRFQSIALLGRLPTPIQYTGCVHVTVGLDDLRFEAALPFRPGHPPLAIPRSAIATIREASALGYRYAVVELRDADRQRLPTIRLGGRAARALLGA